MHIVKNEKKTTNNVIRSRVETGKSNTKQMVVVVYFADYINDNFVFFFGGGILKHDCFNNAGIKSDNIL